MEHRVNPRLVASAAACDELCPCVLTKIIVVLKLGAGMFGNLFFHSVLRLRNKFANSSGKMCVTASLSLSFVTAVAPPSSLFGLTSNSKYFTGFV
jgi:hypothetical protein